MGATARQEGEVAAILRRAAQIMDVLHALRETDERLHLGAGLIRSAVWDRLHDMGAAHDMGKAQAAAPDVDVVYFDAARATPRHDAEIDERLRRLCPTTLWQTRNQARMHIVADRRTPYESLRHAVACWPETCTAIAVRLRHDERLEFVAPWGYFDLLGLVVRPTPAFETRLDVVAARAQSKGWSARWPGLTFQPEQLNSPNFSKTEDESRGT